MDGEVLVYVDLDGVPHLAGRLRARLRKNKESATFEYDPDWLRHPARFALEPALMLGPAAFHTAPDAPLVGAIGDSAPDRWGRALMRRMSRRQAEREGRAVRTLREIDYLLLVDDEARQGALRFAERPGGPFLREADASRIPPLVELPKLLSAAERIVDEDETDEDLRLMFAPGSSLGGARPKASVRLKDGSLAIAKFPRRDDEINVVAWEAVALTLAGKAGMPFQPSGSRSLTAGAPRDTFDRVKGVASRFSARVCSARRTTSREATLNSWTCSAGMARRRWRTWWRCGAGSCSRSSFPTQTTTSVITRSSTRDKTAGVFRRRMT